MALTKTDILVAALYQWKCPACGGRGTYEQDAKGRLLAEAQGKTPDPHYQPGPVPCKVCAGTRLHPTAQAALEISGFAKVAP